MAAAPCGQPHRAAGQLVHVPAARPAPRRLRPHRVRVHRQRVGERKAGDGRLGFGRIVISKQRCRMCQQFWYKVDERWYNVAMQPSPMGAPLSASWISTYTEPWPPGHIQLSLRSTAQPLYTSFNIIFSSCVSEAGTIGCTPHLAAGVDVQLEPPAREAQRLRQQLRPDRAGAAAIWTENDSSGSKIT